MVLSSFCWHALPVAKYPAIAPDRKNRKKRRERIMIKSTTANINLDKINIPSNYAKTVPVQKIMDRFAFYNKSGTFDREIIVDEHYNLIDGYSTYLACKILGLTKVRALRIKVTFTTDQLLDMLRDQIGRDFARMV